MIPFKYCGEYFDKSSGTYYLRARYYNPEIGRFISEDSYWGSAEDPLSLNLYIYCSNNPVLFWDPSGHYHADANPVWENIADDWMFMTSFVDTSDAKYTKSYIPNIAITDNAMEMARDIATGIDKLDDSITQFNADLQKKAVETVAKTIQAVTPEAFIAKGLSVAAGALLGTSKELGIVIDTSGNYGLYEDTSKNDIVAGGSGSLTRTLTIGSGDFSYIRGDYNRIGGSAGEVAVMGIDFTWRDNPTDSITRKFFTSVTIFAGLGGGTPVEVHQRSGETQFIEGTTGNIFNDIINRIDNKAQRKMQRWEPGT